MQLGEPTVRYTTAPETFDEQFVIKDPQGDPIVGFHYKITTSGGKTYKGVTNERGETLRVWTRWPEVLRIARDDQKIR